MTTLQFPPEFSLRVTQSLKEKGFCILSGEELRRLLESIGDGTEERLQVLHEFAETCHARVETTPHLTIARFIPSNRDVTHAPTCRVIRNDSY